MGAKADYQRRYLASIEDAMHLLTRELEKANSPDFEPAYSIESQLHQLSLAHTRYFTALDITTNKH